MIDRGYPDDYEMLVHNLTSALIRKDLSRLWKVMTKIRTRFHEEELKERSDSSKNNYAEVFRGLSVVAMNAHMNLVNYLGGFTEHEAIENKDVADLIYIFSRNGVVKDTVVPSSEKNKRVIKFGLSWKLLESVQEGVYRLSPTARSFFREHPEFCRKGSNCPLKYALDALKKSSQKK